MAADVGEGGVPGMFARGRTREHGHSNSRESNRSRSPFDGSAYSRSSYFSSAHSCQSQQGDISRTPSRKRLFRDADITPTPRSRYMDLAGTTEGLADTTAVLAILQRMEQNQEMMRMENQALKEELSRARQELQDELSQVRQELQEALQPLRARR